MRSWRHASVKVNPTQRYTVGALLLGTGIFLPFASARNVGGVSALWMGKGGLIFVFAVVALMRAGDHWWWTCTRQGVYQGGR